ncbi:MAG: hypothetical protein RIS70_1209, partial [Planctomycetota bacterium]
MNIPSQVPILCSKPRRILTHPPPHHNIEITCPVVLQPRLLIRLAACEGVDVIDRRIRLRCDLAERIVLDVILHRAAGVHEIANRPQVIRQRPQKRPADLFVGQNLINGWAMQIAVSQIIRPIELQRDIVAIVNIPSHNGRAAPWP